jgi:hypothetical protein
VNRFKACFPKLTRRQESALAALMAQPTIKGAADLCGVAEVTLRRWLSDDDLFRRRYRTARRELVEQGLKHLQAATSTAAKCLWQICRGEDLPPAPRVSAARTVIQFALRGLEEIDLANRIEHVEARLDAFNSLDPRSRERP